MKPYDHAVKSIKRYGGKVSDYAPIHEFLDMTKAAHPDVRHRAILHNSMGPYIAVRVFGEQITNSDGKVCDVRQICEDHIIEDMGRIPTVSWYLDKIPMNNIGGFAYSSNGRRNVD